MYGIGPNFEAHNLTLILKNYGCEFLRNYNLLPVICTIFRTFPPLIIPTIWPLQLQVFVLLYLIIIIVSHLMCALYMYTFYFLLLYL